MRYKVEYSDLLQAAIPAAVLFVAIIGANLSIAKLFSDRVYDLKNYSDKRHDDFKENFILEVSTIKKDMDHMKRLLESTMSVLNQNAQATHNRLTKLESKDKS